MNKLHDSIAEALSHFRFKHLTSDALRNISAPFAMQAVHMVRTNKHGPALTRALGHLRRAKDEAVTAYFTKQGDELQAIAMQVIADADEWLSTFGVPFVIADKAP
jgi:hypothetical protein